MQASIRVAVQGDLSVQKQSLVGIPEMDVAMTPAGIPTISGKGAGWAARLLDGCAVHELPVTVTGFLAPIYAAFPKPVDVAAIAEHAEAVPPAEPGAPA